MNFSEFIRIGSHDTSYVLNSYTVIYCVGDSYPAFFFSLLLRHIRAKGVSLTCLDLLTNDKALSKAHCETTFLGSSGIYWLGNLDELNQNDNKYWNAYLQSYFGPNILLCFTNAHPKVNSKSACVIRLPGMCDTQTWHDLLAFVSVPGTPVDQAFINEIKLRRSQITLEEASMLVSYTPVIGTDVSEFSTEWLDELIVSKESLFDLSESFFSKNATLFFKRWVKISHLFPSQFWIAYWSEQLLRAYGFIAFNRMHDSNRARTIGARLPFSFIRRDWQKISLIELYNAHQRLYEIDFSLKNGGSEIFLEHFYSSFIKNNFDIYPSL